MHRRTLRRWRHLLPALLGVAPLACLHAGAQRTPAFMVTLPNLPEPVVPAPKTLEIPAPELPDLSTAAPELSDLAAPDPVAEAALPDAPAPQNTGKPIERQEQRSTTPGFPPVSPSPGLPLPQGPRQSPGIPSEPSVCLSGMSTETANGMSCAPKFNAFQRFVDSADIHPLTARQKAILAFRNTTDPYNFATIGLVSAVSVASDPHSPYGPGVPGFGRNFGVAYCETAVGEFFGTFLVPAIAHQDPHYHRMPNASYARRALHTVTQVVWAQSDYGIPMPNYANLITTAVGDGLGNLYVPGRQKDWGSGVARYATAIATDPIDNLITEFLPDVARHVNVRIVLIQRVINEVEKQN